MLTSQEQHELKRQARREGPYQLSYTKRGRGYLVSAGTIRELAKRLPALFVNAIIRNAIGEIVGECHDRHSHDLLGNMRWCWWWEFDQER